MPFKSFPGSYSLMTVIGNALNCKTITKEISLFLLIKIKKDYQNIFRHWLCNWMICVKQLTFVSLHCVNISQAIWGFQSISFETSILKVTYIVVQGETICACNEADDPGSHSLACSQAVPFHMLPTTCARHCASSSVLHHSSISLAIPADTVTFFVSSVCQKIGNKPHSFPLLYLQQDTVLLSLFS